MASIRILTSEPARFGSDAEHGSAVSADRRAIAQVVESHFGELRMPVYTYVYALCGSAERSEELTQEAFLRLFRCLVEGKNVENVRSWVFRVAHNLAVNEGRKRRFEVPMMRDEIEWRTPSDPGPDPEKRMLVAERAIRFRDGMALLTDHQRHCMQLRAEGFKTQQIAEVLSISRASVVETLERAVRRLRKVLL